MIVELIPRWVKIELTQGGAFPGLMLADVVELSITSVEEMKSLKKKVPRKWYEKNPDHYWRELIAEYAARSRVQ